MKRNRKFVSIILALSLLVSLLAPIAPALAANTVNSIRVEKAITDDFEGYASTLTIREDDAADLFKAGMMFKLRISSGADWQVDGNGNYMGATARGDVPAANIKPYGSSAAGTDLVFKVVGSTLEITVPNVSGDIDIMEIPLYIEDVESDAGTLNVTIDPNDNAISSGSYPFAVVRDGNTTAVVDKVEMIGKGVNEAGTVTITESAGGVITEKTTITFKLSSNFEWDSATEVLLGGGFDGAAVEGPTGYGTRTLTYTLTPAMKTGTDGKLERVSNTRGTIYIYPHIKATSSASYGDVELSISGSGNVEDADLIIAEYVDWGVDFSVKSVKELAGGKLDDITTETITIEENVSGSLLDGRDLTFTLPSWVKVTNIKSFSSNKGLNGTKAPEVNEDQEIDGTSNEFDITIKNSGSSAGKIEFKLELSIEAGNSGDIEAVISGAGIDGTTLVIAEAVSPIDATVDSISEVKVGVQAQEIADIYITENIKEAIKNRTVYSSATANLELTAPSGVKFAGTPTVEVTEGNLTLESGAKLTTDDTVFTIPIDSDSTRPSTIKISNIKLTVDRTYPEGTLNLKIGGPAVVENAYSVGKGWLGGSASNGGTDTTDAGEFVTKTAVSLKVAECVTAAPTDYNATSVFTIGSTTYTVNGVERTMDVAPYLQYDRTYLPVRFVAYAAGVTESNIMYNEEDQSVILVKGDRVVKLTIGDTTMMINGVPFTMDVAPELVDPGRTMLPIRWVAQALGCTIDWDGDTNAVTVVTSN